MSIADPSPTVPRRHSQQTSPRSTWRTQLKQVSRYAKAVARDEPIPSRISGRQREAWFVLNVAESRGRGQIVVDLRQRETKKSGDFGKIKKLSVCRLHFLKNAV